MKPPSAVRRKSPFSSTRNTAQAAVPVARTTLFASLDSVDSSESANATWEAISESASTFRAMRCISVTSWNITLTRQRPLSISSAAANSIS